MPIHGAPSPPMCVRIGELAIGIGQPHRHGVASDAAAGDLARQQQRGAIVRTAGTEIRRARRRELARPGRDVVDELHARGGLSVVPREPSRLPTTFAILSGSSSPVGGNRGAPSASVLPSTMGRAGKRYSASRSCNSRKLRFSSTTRIVSSPWANSRANSGSSGKVMPNFATRMPSAPARRHPGQDRAAPASDRNRICRRWQCPAKRLSLAPMPRLSRFKRANSMRGLQAPHVHLVFQRERDRRDQPRVDVSSDNLPEAESRADPDRPSPCRRRRRHR